MAGDARGLARPRVRPVGALGSVVVVLAALACAVGLTLARPTPVLAACAREVDTAAELERAQIAFVGTVTELQNEGRWVRVRVEEVWRGGELPSTVEVRGGSEPGTTTASDRVYGPLRYLFLVDGAGEWYTDDACSGTAVWTPEIEALRPPSVTPNVPVGGGAPLVTFADVAPVVALAVLVGIAVLAYLAILRARRRPPDWMR